MSKSGRRINLELLKDKLASIVYEPEIFCGLVYRRLDPKTTIIMFSTGKIVSIGTRSEEIARRSINATISEIANIERDDIGVGNITTENVVAISDLGCSIDIEKAAHGKIKAVYEPEQFPGAVYVLENGSKSLIFKTGKIITVGSKSEHEASLAILQICGILKESGCLQDKRSS